jgi:hypothetical protein
MRRGKSAFVLEPPSARVPAGTMRNRTSTELKQGSFDAAVESGPCLIMSKGQPMAVLRKHDVLPERNEAANGAGTQASDFSALTETAEKLRRQTEAARRDVARRAAIKRRLDHQIEQRLSALRTCGDPLAARLDQLFEQLKQDDEDDTMPIIDIRPEPHPMLLDLARRTVSAVESIERTLSGRGPAGVAAGAPPPPSSPGFPKAIELYFADRDSAGQCADELAKRYRFVWLSVLGRYRTTRGNPRECWLYVWWTDGTSWGDRPENGYGKPVDRTHPVSFEQLGPDKP